MLGGPASTEYLGGPKCLGGPNFNGGTSNPCPNPALWVIGLFLQNCQSEVCMLLSAVLSAGIDSREATPDL